LLIASYYNTGASCRIKEFSQVEAIVPRGTTGFVAAARHYVPRGTMRFQYMITDDFMEK
jgi:hypothetical protein